MLSLTNECQVIAIFPWVGIILLEVYSQFLHHCKPMFPAHHEGSHASMGQVQSKSL